jgi:simple sugar transport system ATP-binding protein
LAAAAQPGEAGPLIRLEGITKAFVPGRPVLQDVDLQIARGEIHALLGENGAGKSTLMNVLIGLVTPDAGSARIDGQEVDLARFGPGPALAAGIAMVHQHSSLVPGMTVEENLCFGDPQGGFRFSRRRAARRLEALGREFNLEVSLGARVEDLSVGQRQRAEILRALDRGAALLILDEPTAALTPSETLELFPALRRLRERGRSVIFISHKLDEVEALADRVTVLRRGAVVGARDAGALDARELGRMMLGRDLSVLERPVPPVGAEPGAEPLLALRDVSASGLRDGSALRALSLSLGAGEILGIAGIDGNGQRELEEVLAGVRRMSGGAILVAGESVPPRRRPPVGRS